MKKTLKGVGQNSIQSKKVGIQNKNQGSVMTSKGQATKKKVVNQQKVNIDEKESNADSQEDYDQENNQFNNRLNDIPKLTQAELNELMPNKMLQPNNPQAFRNYAIYSYKDRKYNIDDLVENYQLVIHFSYDGELVSKESNEAKIQEEIEEIRKNALNQAIKNKEMETGEKVKLNDHKEIKAIKKILRNKFNYNERQSQTMNSIIRERGVTTEPLPSDNYVGNVTQWEIFDAYLQDYLKEKRASKEQEKQKEKETGNQKQKKDQQQSETSSYYTSSFKKALKIMERTVVNNDEKDKYNDYKYFYTEHQDIKDLNSEGQIMLLWRFHSDKMRKKHVTSICWNPKYKDLFAIGLGSYEFMRQKMGLVCLFSIKNTSHPEYSFNTESGVMALDFHPSSPALLAVGLYDGTVLVYDIRNKHKRPIYQSTIRTQKHTDPVWQVAWNPDVSKKFNFYSISSDGRVMNWVLMKNKIEPEEVIRLKLTGKNNDDETALIGLACGLCFDFSPFHPNIFLVGTEEGKIHKCSRAYSGQYQQTYTGHDLAVYKVRWNKFHDRTFVSAGADWTVKVWDTKINTPILSLDLGMPVVDVNFAPYSSTILACATLEKCIVYDLHVDKHGKRAEQKPTKQPKLTNLAFNPYEPTILIGDDHGGSTLIKLNNTLYKIERPKEFENITQNEYERMKMESILNLQGKFQRDDV